MSEHVAGRELDALIAEKVMGWEVRKDDLACGRKFILSKVVYPISGLSIVWSQRDEWYQITGSLDDLFPCAKLVPCYSTDIAAAWQVVSASRKRDVAFVLGANGCSEQFSAWFHDGIWALGRQQNTVPEFGDRRLLGSASASTAPLAICLAALKAAQ